MLQFEGKKGVRSCDGVTRRDFLRAGALSAGAVGLSLTELAQPALAGASRGDVNCILLFLVGGPSQLDTWDMKPDAPAEVRGPYRPIATKVAGVQIKTATQVGQGTVRLHFYTNKTAGRRRDAEVVE